MRNGGAQELAVLIAELNGHVVPRRVDVGEARAGQAFERRQAGQSLTELPIAIVLLLALTFGIVDASRLIYAYNVVSASAREGVRWAVVRGGTSGRTATAADVTSFVQGVTVGTPVTVAVTWTPDSQPGSTVVVTVTSNFAPIAPLPLVPKTIKVTSTSSLVISR